MPAAKANGGSGRVSHRFGDEALITMTDLCFVTPSYHQDFARCRLLVESRECLAPDVDHYLIVDKADLTLFAPLASLRTHIVDSRDVFDREFFPLPFMKGWWQSPYTLPIRGWMTQQIRKLAIGRIADQRLIINIDSDVVLLRPFDPAVFVNGAGETALFAVDWRNEETVAWSGIAARLLGGPPAARPNNHVGMMIPWRRDLLASLLERVAATAGQSWQRTIARLSTFSEYQLYGHYVENVLGLDAARAFVFSTEIVKPSWNHPITDAASLQRFFAELTPDHIAAMVHSKDGIPSSQYEAMARRIWAGKTVG